MQNPAARLAIAWWRPPPATKAWPARPSQTAIAPSIDAPQTAAAASCIPAKAGVSPPAASPQLARLPGRRQGRVVAVAAHGGDEGRRVDALDLARRSPAAARSGRRPGAGRARRPGSGPPRAGAAGASSGGRRRGCTTARPRRGRMRCASCGGTYLQCGPSDCSGGRHHGPGHDAPPGDEPRGHVGVAVGEGLDLVGRRRRAKTMAAPVGGSPSAPAITMRPSADPLGDAGEVRLAVGRPPLDDVGDVVVEQDEVAVRWAIWLSASGRRGACRRRRRGARRRR